MSSLERRKLLCSVSFHVIAITCVVWSLYVLVDRTAEEIKLGELQWSFWTKLVVVAIGFTGGLVFMYVQCKAYLHLCKKWKAYNRVIVVQDVPATLLEQKRRTSVQKSLSSGKSNAQTQTPLQGITLRIRTSPTSESDAADECSPLQAPGGDGLPADCDQAERVQNEDKLTMLPITSL